MNRSVHIVDSEVLLRLSVGAKGSIETESLQTVASQRLIRLLVILLGQAVDRRQVLLALRGKIEIEDLRKLFDLLACGVFSNDDSGIRCIPSVPGCAP